MYRGYIAIWRKIQDHPFYKERRIFSKLEAWIDILMEAQHSEESKDIILGMTILKCNYGECLKSKRTWAKRWGWSESKVRRYFKTLSKLNQITEKNEGSTTRLTILNYKQYDPKATHEPTQRQRTPDAEAVTDKNVKKEKNVKNTENIYAHYLNKIKPAKKSKQRTLKNVGKILNKNICAENLISAIDNYSINLNSDSKYRFDPANFFGRDEQYKDYLPEHFIKPEKKRNVIN